MLEGDESAMFNTNEDGTQQQVYGVGETCIHFYDPYQYMFNLQRALFVPSFKFHLISIQLLFKPVNTKINENPDKFG